MLKSILLASFIAAFLQYSTSLAFVTEDECGRTKSCYSFPPDCSIANDDNCRFVSWISNSSSGSVVMELMSSKLADSSDLTYIAFAFGLENVMKDADTYYCANGAFTSASIVEEHRPPIIVPLGSGMSVERVGMVNGRVQCRYTRPIAVTKVIVNDIHEFDIESNNYFILMAEGILDENGNLRYHTWRSITPDKLNFSVPLPTVQVSTTVAELTTMLQNITMDASLPSTPEPGTAVPELTVEPTAEPTTTSGSCHLHINTWFLILAASVSFLV